MRRYYLVPLVVGHHEEFYLPPFSFGQVKMIPVIFIFNRGVLSVALCLHALIHMSIIAITILTNHIFSNPYHHSANLNGCSIE